MPEPVAVSVLIVTYNHAKFIAQAIESVLMQDCSAPFEILISEDASTDGTRDIVAEYAKRYPDRITLLLSDQNLASNEVVARGLRSARGEFICLLDGDDFWTSKSKLQWQVEFLRSHPAVAAHFFNAVTACGENITKARWTGADQPHLMTLDEIWLGNPFATCTGMMRSYILKNIPTWYRQCFPITDWPLYLLCAEQGSLAFTDEVVGVYRLHSGGMFTALPDRRKRETIEAFYRYMSSVLTPPEALAARAGCSRYFIDMAKSLGDEGDVRGAFDCLCRSLRSGKRHRNLSLKAGVKFLATMARAAK